MFNQKLVIARSIQQHTASSFFSQDNTRKKGKEKREKEGERGRGILVATTKPMMDFDIVLKIVLVDTSKRDGIDGHQSPLVDLLASSSLLLSLSSSSEDDEDGGDEQSRRRKKEREKKAKEEEERNKKATRTNNNNPKRKHVRKRSGSAPEEPFPQSPLQRTASSPSSSSSSSPHNSLSSVSSASSSGTTTTTQRRKRLSLGATIGRVVTNLSPRTDREKEYINNGDDREKCEKKGSIDIVELRGALPEPGWGGGEVASRLFLYGDRKILVQFWVATTDG